MRDWLFHMMGVDPDRRIDKQRGRKKQKMDAAARKAITERVDNSPTVYGFAAGTWQLDMISAMPEGEINIECKPRTLRLVMKRTGARTRKPGPYRASRPPKKSGRRS